MKDIVSESNDRLLLYGYGLFETLRITSAGIEIPMAHWQRMKAGGQILGLEVPAYEAWLHEIKNFIIIDPPVKPYALRITLSGGSQPQRNKPRLLINTRKIPYTLADYQQGVRVCFLSAPRSEYSILSRIKSTNYIENILAREEALSAQAREGLWLNTQGHLAEGTISNVFYIKDGVIHTPSLDCGCLAGTRRAVVLRLALELGISAKQGKYTPSELKEADLIFLTNSLMGLMPVSDIDDQKKRINSRILDELVTAYDNYIKQNSVIDK